jgi:hypothetical protein
MLQNRSFVALIVVVVWALQAGDSHVLAAPVWIQALVAVAILIPSAVLFVSDSGKLRLLAVASAGVLLVGTRMLSPVSHNELLLVLLIPAAAGALSALRARRREDCRPA